MILTAIISALVSVIGIQASNGTESSRRQDIGIFLKKWECDPGALYPCGTKDTSAVCTAVHGKNVCYCTAPFYVLDEYTGQCESISRYTDNCSPDQFVCGLDPHARCLVTLQGKTCVCSPGFVNLGHKCFLDPVFVFTQTLKKAATSGGITAIALASLSYSWAQNQWCYTDDEIGGLAGFIPHWIYTGDLFSAFRCPTLENFVEEEVFHIGSSAEERNDEQEDEVSSENFDEKHSDKVETDASEEHEVEHSGEDVFLRGMDLIRKALTWIGL